MADRMATAGDARSASKTQIFLALLAGCFISIVGYGLGRAFVYATPTYALMKLPFDILASLLGSFLAYSLYYLSSFSKTLQKALR